MNMTKKGSLIRLRRALAKRGAKAVEITHRDGRKTAIEDAAAVKAALDALKVELDRQIEELGISPKRSAVAEGELNAGCDEARSGLDEIVRDWLLREHPEERKFMDDFSETVTFRKLVERMEAGENFYEILDCSESQQREFVFTHLADITDKPYDHWYYLWLSGGDKAKFRKYMARAKARLRKASRKGA